MCAGDTIVCGAGVKNDVQSLGTAFQGSERGGYPGGSTASLIETGELVRVRASWAEVFAVWEGQESPRGGGQHPAAPQAVHGGSRKAARASRLACDSLWSFAVLSPICHFSSSLA